jgi:myo-inositol-1(or 4)-monophosphatase
LRALEPIARASLKHELADIVREAGALAASKFGSPELKSWTKHGSSPVTESDIAVDKLLRERLTRLVPEAAWLSEESEDDRARLGASRLWIVDPIDGTRAYVGGLPDWSVSVALVEDGRPVLGCIYAPMDDGLYLAVSGEGATRDGVPIAPNHDTAPPRVAGPKPMIAELEKSLPDLVAIPKVHSLALRLARVAAGRLDVAFASKNSHDWDLAAADLIVHEAGGMLRTLDGELTTYNSHEARHSALVATSRARQDSLIAITRGWQPAGALKYSLT